MAITIDQAIAYFMDGRYEEALKAFTELYNAGVEQEKIMDILLEAFYEPNEEEMRSNYSKQCCHSSAVPVHMG